MRLYFPLVLVLVVLISAGCVEEYTPENTTVTPAPAPVTPGVVATPAGPVTAPTPPPAEMAYISNIECGTGDKWGSEYHCNGYVRIRGGTYDEVQVIARYPDNNTFKSGTVSLGGGDAVSKPFFFFPDLKYQGQTPAYSVRLDKSTYPVSWSGATGVAWSNRE